MAVYSDLLFTVSGDPIDIRASIYEIEKLYDIFPFDKSLLNCSLFLL
jgi:hypothetical protein